jgi:hypothetical protein
MSSPNLKFQTPGTFQAPGGDVAGDAAFEVSGLEFVWGFGTWRLEIPLIFPIADFNVALPCHALINGACVESDSSGGWRR